MDGFTLCEMLNTFLSAQRIEALCEEVGLVQRKRCLEIVPLVRALVLCGGSDDSGRQADVYTTYLNEANETVVRSSFYAWFTPALAWLMILLVREAMERVKAMTPLLPKGLQGVEDWIIVDSETIRLPKALEDECPSTTKGIAAIKVHKLYSLGRNNMVDFHISPAREHDGPHLHIEESWRGYGLIVDLGYASLRLIRQCQRHGVALLLRLKRGWKPRLIRLFEESGDVLEWPNQPTCPGLLDLSLPEDTDADYDFDVAFGAGRDRVEARLVGTPGAEGYHWCITLLGREAFPVSRVCKLYRARWEIERDNRRDKGAARLDQIRARRPDSVCILLCSALLRNLLSNALVHRDLQSRPSSRAPLAALALSLTLTLCASRILLALSRDDKVLWQRLAHVLRARGHDPNWRRRPSHLDQLRGTTAPPGRNRRKPRPGGRMDGQRNRQKRAA